MTDGVTFRACFRAVTPSVGRCRALKVLPAAAAADRASQTPPWPSWTWRSGTTRGLPCKPRARRDSGKCTNHEADGRWKEGGRGENEGKGAFLLRKGFQSPSLRSRRGGKACSGSRAVVSPARPSHSSPAPIMHFRIRRFAGSTTFRSRIDSTSEEFDDDKREKALETKWSLTSATAAAV